MNLLSLKFFHLFIWILMLLFGALNYPFAICVFLLLFAIIEKNHNITRNNYVLYLVIFFFSFLVSLINAFKIPENDLIWYLQSYMLSGQLNLKDYVEIGADAIFRPTWKDPFFSTIVWCLNRLLNGNEMLFKFAISFMDYSILTLAFYLYWKKHFNRSLIIYLSGVIFLCSFPLIFTMSLHLLRQFMSSCLMMFALVLACFYQKQKTKDNRKSSERINGIQS